MSAGQVVQELERLGVRLWEDAGQLRFRAPQGVMTGERKEQLRREKEAILQHLREASEKIEAAADPASRFEPFPLTDLQSAYVIGRRTSIAYGGVACHAYGELGFPDLDPDRVQRAWDRLVARHDMLRAIVETDGFQRVLPEAPPYRVELADLRGADAARVRARIDRVRNELDHKVHPLGAWPMFDLMVTRADARSVLHLSIDFLIADYVSVQVLLSELRTLYRDPDAALPPIDLTFRDYLRAERRLKSGSRYDRDRAYWWSRIDALPPRPELPTLPPADASAPVRFRRVGSTVSAAAYAALQRRAQAHDVTASGAVLAAYAETIARWCRHPRFSLNLTVLRRLPVHAHVNQIVGDFTAIDVLAIDAAPQAPFQRRARAIQAQLWEDLDHGLCSGVEVMREMTRRRGAGSALMPIVYTSALGLGRDDAQASPDVNGEFVYGISQTPQVWIDCQVMQPVDQLAINWDVREGVFPEGLVEDMFAAFVALVESLSSSDAAWESSSPIALPAAQVERRRRVNATDAPLPDGLLHDAFVAQARRSPDRTALVAQGRSLTYGELLQLAHAVADRLLRDGCRPGDLVGVWAPKGIEQVVGVLGTMLGGAAYLPIDVDQPRARRQQMLSSASVRHVLTTSALAESSDGEDESAVALIAVDALEPIRSDELPPRTASPDDLAYVIYTSGSTGAPKGVMITHRAALNTVQDINARFGVGATDRLLGLAQLGFDLSVYDIFGALAAGAALVLPDAEERSNPSHWAQMVAAHGVTVWNSVPAQLQMLHEYLTSEPLPLPTLRLAMLSGDWIPIALPDLIRAQLPSLSVVSLGGATEAAIWSIAYPIDRVAPEWASIPYGRPLVNQTFHVLDAAMRQSPDWVPGELYIGGAGLALGYLGDAEKTAARFITHPATGERLYRTGDLGRYLPDGNIEFLGREDSQVKIRGHRIELAEVESALQSHPDVARAASVVHGDRPLDRKLAGFVEPARRRDEDTGGIERFAETVAERLGPLDPNICNDVVQFSRQLDHTALTAMIRAFIDQGLFATPEARHSLDDILATARVSPKHHRLVRRWLKALERHQLVARDESGAYRRLVDVGPSALDEAWREVEQLQTRLDQRPELLEYFRLTSHHLPELLRGELDPVQLLFPQGRVEIHEVAYTDNFLSRYHNTLVTTAVSLIADQHRLPCPFRLLEPGAGVGGTSVELIPTLANRRASYLFTDVSPFFLNNARERYRESPWVTFGLFDINRDYRSQGLTPNSFDVIVCANVLHYARNAATVLSRFSELLRPDGWLVFIDMMRDSYQVLTSMEFLFDATVNDFEDVRAHKDETFISQPQWEQLLRDAGAEIAMCLPASDEVLAECGFRVFAARFKHDRVPLCVESVEPHLAERLPDYMIPPHLQIVDALPTTDNGKIDRTTLRSWVPAASGESDAVAIEEPTDDLERRLAAVWRTVLRLERVGRNQDFFELGGDSLVAAQLVGRMREEVPEAASVFFDTLLRLVLDGPTIAKIAAHLTSGAASTSAGGGAAQTARSPLVQLPGAKDGPLRVLVHDASGTLASYAGILDDLGKSGRVSGFVVSDASFVGTQPAVAVRRAAATYARALASAPQDGVHLIGADVGGILAVEIARHLVEAGVEVSGLTVINSLPIAYLVDDELLAEYLFVFQSGVDPVRLGYPSEAALAHALDVILRESFDRIPSGKLSSIGGDADLDAVAWCFRRLAARAVDDRMAAIGRAVAQSAAGAAPAGQVQALYDVFRHSLRAFALHEVAPYAGDILVVRATEPTPLTRRIVDESADFWRGVSLGDVRVADVSGRVQGCLRPPDATDVASAITSNEMAGAAAR